MRWIDKQQTVLELLLQVFLNSGAWPESDSDPFVGSRIFGVSLKNVIKKNRVCFRIGDEQTEPVSRPKVSVSDPMVRLAQNPPVAVVISHVNRVGRFVASTKIPLRNLPIFSSGGFFAPIGEG